MPTYSYRCQSCEKVFDIMQKITDEPLTACSECEGSLVKIIHPAGIIFKGSGFYKTDYANKKPSGSTPPSCPAVNNGCSSTPCPANN